MVTKQLPKYYYGLAAILVGLILTHLLATLHVYLSNLHLFRTMTTISEAGYLAVPNQHVMAVLKDLRPALYGALFFTLTLGAGLSVAAVFLCYLWNHLFGRHRLYLILPVLLWLGTVVLFCFKGSPLMVILYFLLVPPAVFVTAVKWTPGPLRRRAWGFRIMFIAPMVLLGLLWVIQVGQEAFLNIRDYILFSNPVGKSVNDFYYRYTLYPAEVFKTYNQKLLKTCDLSAIEDQSYARHLERLLLYYDYLPVSNAEKVDLTVDLDGNNLVLKHNDKAVHRTTLQAFSSAPLQELRAFSENNDRYGLFRKATIVSLSFGSPVLLYIIIFSLIYVPLDLIVRRVTAGESRFGQIGVFAAAASICFIIGLGLLIPLHLSKSLAFEPDEINSALGSPKMMTRVAALKTIANDKLDVGDYPEYRRLLDSPHIPERYWLAQTLGTSRSKATYQDLLSLMNDPSSDVVRAAIYGLGLRRNRAAGRDFFRIVENSNDWYIQWYAYRSLRGLGWRQARSN